MDDELEGADDFGAMLTKVGERMEAEAGGQGVPDGVTLPDAPPTVLGAAASAVSLFAAAVAVDNTAVQIAAVAGAALVVVGTLAWDAVVRTSRHRHLSGS